LGEIEYILPKRNTVKKLGFFFGVGGGNIESSERIISTTRQVVSSLSL
jgi:hypothetical protein